MSETWLRLALLDDGWERVTIEEGLPLPQHSHITCERWSALVGESFTMMKAVRTEWLQTDATQSVLFERARQFYAAAVSAAMDDQWTGPPTVSIEAQMEALADALFMRGPAP